MMVLSNISTYNNMTAQNYLKSVLYKWVNQFEGIMVRYAYDAVTEYHIIEVEPEKIRRENDEYKEAELHLWMDFMRKYPDESLLICAPSDTNDMSNEIFSSVDFAKEALPQRMSFDVNGSAFSFDYPEPMYVQQINEYALAA